MEPIEIKILLKRKQISILSIAQGLRVRDAFVHQVINGQRHTKRVRMAIAKAVGKRIKELWPSKSFKKAA